MGAMATQVRSAIAVHHTDTTDESWDSGLMVKQMGDEPGEANLRLMHAWVDPDGDPATKAAYKFPHHMCSMDGSVGAANMTACSSGIGVLNGGRGGTTIPETDHPAVWRHLAAHLRDGDQEPPALRAARGYTQRSFAVTEVRLSDAGAVDPLIEGYVVPFDVPALIHGFFGSFRETVAPGAFKKTVRENDIRALFNHNPDWILGRNRAGTLTLGEDSRGLAFTIKPPDTSYARDLIESMRRGDITEMSFGFEAIKDQWTFSRSEEPDDRRLLEVRLWDVSPVTFPAYPQTEAYVRSAIAALQCYVTPPEPTPRGHSESTRREPPTPRHSLEQLRSRLAALPDQEAPRNAEPARVPSHSLAEYRAWLSRVEQFS